MTQSTDSNHLRRLLVIGPEPPPLTGMEVATAALVAELRRAHVPIARINTSDPSDMLSNRGRWSWHNVSQGLRSLAQAARLTLRRDVGAVYVPIAQEVPAFYRDAGFILLAHAARKPVVIHLHGGAFGRFYAASDPFVRALVRLTVGRAALGLVLSDRLRSALECVLPPHRVATLPNGLDLDVPPAPRQDDASLHLLFLSNLVPEKGIFVFLDAFARAAELRPGLRATVAGAWPSDGARDEILDYARSLGVASSVTFLGTIGGDEKRRAFAEADVLCFPSYYPLEGMPLVLIEALAAGLPVIATAHAAIPDLVVEGETGLLIATASADLLADKIVHLADHPEERRRMSDAARRLHREQFTQAAFGERLVALVRPVLEPAAAGRSTSRS